MRIALAGGALVCAGLAAPAAGLAQEAEFIGTVLLGGLIPSGQSSYSRAYGVDIITGDELREAGDILVSDYLARRAGLSLSRNGGPGQTTTLRVRGLGNEYVSVRIDGIEVNDPSNTKNFFDFGGLTTSGVSKIEILRGSQSAAYGSDSVGGVINIVTARPDEPGTHVSADAEAGSFGTRRGGLRVATRTGRADLAFDVSRLATDGISAADEDAGNDESDAFEQTHVTFSAAYQLDEALRVGLSGFRTTSQADFDEIEFTADGAVPVDGTPDETTESRMTGVRAFAEAFAFGVEHTFALSRLDTDRVSRSDGVATDFEGERVVTSYTGATETVAGMALAFGFERSEESFGSSFDGGEQTTWGAFGEAVRPLGPAAELALALRYDAHSEFDDVVSGRAALAVDLGPSTTFRAAAATGFRAPSLYERLGSFGNPDLEAERSQGIELGLERAGQGRRVEATAFFTQIDDLIQFGDTRYVQVDGTSRTRGLEVVAEWAVSDRLTAFGNYTYTDAEDAEGQRLVRVPRNDLLLGVEAAITERLAARLDVRHVADTVGFGGDLDDHTVADLRLSVALDDRTEAYVRVENLLDEDYQTSRGYGTPDRSVFAGFRASF